MKNSSGDVNLFFFSFGSILIRKLFQKIKIVCRGWNLEPILIGISRMRWGFLFVFFFRSKIPLLGYFGPKIQNCEIKLKFAT